MTFRYNQDSLYRGPLKQGFNVFVIKGDTIPFEQLESTAASSALNILQQCQI